MYVGLPEALPSAPRRSAFQPSRPCTRFATLALVLVFSVGGFLILTGDAEEERFALGIWGEPHDEAGAGAASEDRSFGIWRPDHRRLPLHQPHLRPTASEPSPGGCLDVYALPDARLVAPKNFTADVSRTEYRILIPGKQASEFIAPSWGRALLEAKKSGSWDQVEWMRNRSVLVIGDSLDRNGVHHLGTQLADAGFTHNFLTNSTSPSLARYPTTQSHLVGLAHHAALNFSVANFFLMSIACSSPETSFTPESFFHPGEDMPQFWRDRLETLYLPSLKAGAVAEPDLVVVNSALWDLVYYANKPSRPGRSAWDPLTEAELGHYASRLSELLAFLRQRFRTARLVLRTPHETSAKADENAMSSARIRQLRAAMLEVSERVDKVVDDVMRWGEAVKGREVEMSDQMTHFGVGSAQWRQCTPYFLYSLPFRLTDAVR